MNERYFLEEKVEKYVLGFFKMFLWLGGNAQFHSFQKNMKSDVLQFLYSCRPKFTDTLIH